MQIYNIKKQTFFCCATFFCFGFDYLCVAIFAIISKLGLRLTKVVFYFHSKSQHFKKN